MLVTALTMMILSGDAAIEPSTCANSYVAAMEPEKDAREIKIYASARLPMVMVSIAGQPYMPFAFDTGSSGNLVSLQVAEQLGLPENGPSPSVDGSGNPVPGFDTCLNDMEIGGVKGPDRRATAFPFDRVDEEGIISPMHFSGSLLKLDGPNRRLVILEKDFDTAKLSEPRAWTGPLGDAHPVIDITLGDVTLEARLDSGSDADLILPMEWMEKLDLVTEPVVVGEMQTASARMPIYGARIQGDMLLGADRYERKWVLFAQTGTPLIGWPMMKTMSFYMDPDARMSWFAVKED